MWITSPSNDDHQGLSTCWLSDGGFESEEAKARDFRAGDVTRMIRRCRSREVGKSSSARFFSNRKERG